MPHDETHQFEVVEPRFKLTWWPEINEPRRALWLVRDVLTAGGLSAVYGASGSGKSLFALDLAISVALGKPWRGRRVRMGTAVYVSAEAPKTIWDRILAWKVYHGEDVTIPLAVIEEPPHLDDEKDVEPLIAAIKAAALASEHKVAIVIVDTLSAAMAGSDQSDNAVMAAIANRCRKINEVTGAHVAIVHHTGKDLTRGMRGGSAFRAAIDTEIEVTTEDPDRWDAARCAKITKQRDGEGGSQFGFRVEKADLGNDDEGEPIDAAVLIEDDSGTGRRTKQITGQAGAALDALRMAIDECGKPAPANNHIPPDIKVTTAEMWWTYFQQRAVFTTDSVESQRRAFRRQVQVLQNKHGAVASWGEHVWPT